MTNIALWEPSLTNQQETNDGYKQLHGLDMETQDWSMSQLSP